MKKRTKIIGLLVLIILVIAVCYAYNEYTRKPADLSSVESMAQTDAGSLVKLFETDEQQANQRYLGKAIDVSGIIAGITNQRDTIVNVLLGKNDDMHRVSCLLDAKHISKLKNYKVGDSITLRGICTGYLIDVELNRSVIIR